jgi:hypothetical protein
MIISLGAPKRCYKTGLTMLARYVIPNKTVGESHNGYVGCPQD